MTRFLPRALIAAACFILGGLTFTRAQTTPAPAAATPAAGTNAASAIPPVTTIPVAEIVTQAQTVSAQLQTDQTSLTANQLAQNIDAGLPAVASAIDERSAEDRKLLAESPSLFSLQSSQASWQALADSLSASTKALSDRAKQVSDMLAQLAQGQTTWKATLTSAGTASPEIVQRINAVLAVIAETNKVAVATQAQIFSIQTRVSLQSARVTTGLSDIGKAQDNARNELLTQDHPILWNVEATTSEGAGIVAQEKVSLRAQLDTLQSYLAGKIPALIVHLAILFVLIAGFFWIRQTVNSRAEQEPRLVQAARVFDVPLATAVLLALLATLWLYPLAPRLLWAGVGAIALIPAVIVIRRLIEPALFPILYATVIAYFVDQLRYVLMPAGILSRFLFIFELLAVCIFLLVSLHSKHLSATASDVSRLRKLTRLFFHVSFFVFICAGFANVFGFVHLGYWLGNGMLESSYLAVIFYAAVRILDALIIAALNIRPLSGLRLVRHHHDLLYTNASAFLRWVAFAVWVIAVLQIFTIASPLWQAGYALMTTQHSWGTTNFKLDTILAFPITVWAAFLLSRFIRFCLEEEVYPNLHLGRGIPYATSTMVHYAILVFGFYVAVKALGVDLTQFTVLVSAFAVGLGFGLQNILNNFVSGIILLFERPVKVGDIVQIDTNMGTVQSIGIRASIIRLTNGSEIIMPNGNLISNPVTNWTLSNCERLIEIPVNVASKVDPQHVLELLTSVVRANSSVLKNPPPQTLLATFGGTALTFRVRAWLDSEEEWMKVTSDLSLAINAALAKENIAMS
jgi:potassium efflux system protein